MNKLIRCFLHTDLRCQHTGLAKIAAHHKLNVEKLKPGEHIMFVNNARNKMKMYSPNGVLSYLRLPKGTIDMRTISEIPRAFEGSIALSYKKALTKQIKQELRWTQ